MRQFNSLLRLLIAAVVFIGLSYATSAQAQPKKREFRGAWIQCVNGQFQGLGTQEMQRTLRYQLDELGSTLSSFRCVRSVMPSMRVSMNRGASSSPADKVHLLILTGTRCNG